MKFQPLIILAALLFSLPVMAFERMESGGIEVHFEAVPTNELTAEAAAHFNIKPSPNRGLLTVTILKNAGADKARSVVGQIFAGALTGKNFLINIPVREIHERDEVYYLGEFYVEPTDTLTFLVNASVEGKAFKTKFSRTFNP